MKERKRDDGEEKNDYPSLVSTSCHVYYDSVSMDDFFQFRGQRTVTPSMVYSLKVYDGDNLVHSVYWHDSSLSGTIRARSLRKCFSEIINIIENTEEFKKLPEKRGAYA